MCPLLFGLQTGNLNPIRCPRSTGSEYFNYEGFHSLVLLALVEADHKFTWYGSAVAGSISDAQIFGYSDLSQKTEDNTTGSPPSSRVICG